MAFLRIIKPGLLTTVQDRGRFHYQKWGVPVAGAMDEYALRVGNILVGNHEDEAALEITLFGPEIEFLAPGLVAITGADLRASLNGLDCAPWGSFRVREGDVLRFSGLRCGCRAYLAVAGGIKVPRVMGSKSTYLRGGIGGLNGRALREGDKLEIENELNNAGITVRETPPAYRYKQEYPWVVRVVPGPQDDAFIHEGMMTFMENEYKVMMESDRMGCRLDGPVIRHKNGADIVSDGIAMGSIQVPGDGKPIIMMADRQTTGGYAKIATVITPDLWKIAQAKPGDSILFSLVTLEQAHEVYRQYEKRIKKLAEDFSGTDGTVCKCTNK